MTSIISSIHYITRRSPAMEPITASICFFVMTGGMAGVAMYEHDKIIRYIKATNQHRYYYCNPGIQDNNLCYLPFLIRFQ